MIVSLLNVFQGLIHDVVSCVDALHHVLRVLAPTDKDVDWTERELDR